MAYVVLPIALTLANLFIMAITVPMIKGTIRRNSTYGFRTRRTLGSDEIWYPANKLAGKLLFFAACLSICVVWIAFTIGAPILVFPVAIMLPLLAASAIAFWLVSKM